MLDKANKPCELVILCDKSLVIFENGKSGASDEI